MNPCFAIIDRNTLESTALKEILAQVFNQVEIQAYNSMESFIRDSNRHFIHFFVSSDILFTDAEEFETLKDMTTVLSLGRNTNIEKSGFRTLDVSYNEEELVCRLVQLQKIGHYGNIEAKAQISKDKSNRCLSNREKEVLKLMVMGLINKEIAQKLNISLTTVIFHRNNICEKLQTRSIGKLTIFAVLSGIVDIKEI